MSDNLKITTRTHTRCMLEKDGRSFELTRIAVEDSAILRQRGDGRWVAGYLARDDAPESPREWSHLGHMICWHKGYKLGDDHEFKAPCDLLLDILGRVADKKTLHGIERAYEDEEARAGAALLEDAVRKAGVVLLPLFLYVHGSISMSCSNGYPYNDRWDAGQVGYIYVLPDEIHKEYAVKAGGAVKYKAAAAAGLASEALQQEVATYDQYLRGDVYGVCTAIYADEKHSKSPQSHDELWGTFGYEYALTALQEAVDEAMEVKP